MPDPEYLDITTILYEKFSTDKYTSWIQLLCTEHLRAICERVDRELGQLIFEWMKEYEDDYAELEGQMEEATEKRSDAETKLLLLTESHKKLVDRLDKIGLVWDTEAKTLDITEDSPIRKLKF